VESRVEREVVVDVVVVDTVRRQYHYRYSDWVNPIDHWLIPKS
jgi:hypothetical protein